MKHKHRSVREYTETHKLKGLRFYSSSFSYEIYVLAVTWGDARCYGHFVTTHSYVEIFYVGNIEHPSGRAV